jgi:hypothetical protein
MDRRIGLRLLVGSLLAFGVASCGVARSSVTASSTALTTTGTARGTTPKAAENRAAAHREARALLAKVVLPAAAVRVRSEPAGDGGVLAKPAQLPALADLVDLHGWWRVRGSLSSVYMFVKAHAPHGSRLNGWGRRYPSPRGAFVDFEWPPVTGVSESRSLNIEIVALSTKTTGVRVDGQVVWTMPRPAGERIPAGVHVVDVTREKVGHISRVSIGVIKPATVQRVISAIDRLPIVQPGTVESCPAEPAQPTVIINFRRGHGTPVLARATHTGACGGMQFSIHGTSQIPLANAERMIQELEQFVGVKLVDFR